MKKTRTLASFAAAGVLMGISLAGCTQQQTTGSNDGASETKEQPQSSNMWGHYRPKLGEGENASMMAFPTGEVNTSAVLLHQVMPKQVRRGQDFGYSYHVTNLTNATLQNVVVSLDSTSNLEVKGSQPEATRSGGNMAWPLGDLAAGETKVISLTGNAGQVGSASDCVAVSYNNFLCATTAVVEPALALTKTATATALRCDPIVLRYVVKNSGTGSTSDVVISDTLPTGLTLSDGTREIRIPVGPLAAGESKAFEVRAEANRVGTFESPASASSGDLRASADKTTTVVTEPVLEITSDCGSANQFLGRNFTHTYTVKNNGNGVANNAVATIAMPAGSTVARSSEGGTVAAGRVTWNLGAMAPGASRTFSVTFTGSQAQTYQTTATVNAACAKSVTDSCSNDLKGIPAVLLEVVDIVDPVELGGQTTYLITVTNQGSAPDNNVRIEATLPEEASFVSASGATTSSASGRTITFAPLPSLGVGQQAVWRVVVKADAEGDVRFQLKMTSDNLTSPVTETEATFFYD
tara:strand:- start:50206 stop:51774 length:1569 start_codon:yes stop_codon:yes gene_type:complete